MTQANIRKGVQPTVRCAVYTRKSTEEGLQQEFNTLDAQRESAEAYIASQRHEGWTCLPDRYDDGGFTGGNMERPALKRLMKDIEAGKVDAVCVYKVDRLSRSLLDFARMMETFDKQHVSFVSVTQQFNTATSMGRLVLNVLLSFAQFEREIISERTRDKIAATRRRGKWAGGHPILGYDIDPRGFKLIVNEEEAIHVRTIFDLYLQHESLMQVVQELSNRGWCNKRWTTRKGPERGGKPFTRPSLYKLLRNCAYVGRVRYKTEVHPGEHPGIVNPDTWQRVQTILQRNGRTGGGAVRNKFGAFLKGILRCSPCGLAMTPSHSTKNRTRRYRYYVCVGAQMRGWHSCPSKAISAPEIERFVVERIRCIGRDPALLNEVVGQARVQVDAQVAESEAEQRNLDRELRQWNSEVKKLVEQIVPGDNNSAAIARLADLQERIRIADERATEIRERISGLGQNTVKEADITLAMSLFDPVWDSLTPREQTRAIQLLVERVEYDGAKEKVAITFHPTGIKTLFDQLPCRGKEAMA